mgnify:CR=1 FL=1
MIFTGLLMAAFSGDLGYIFSPLALGLGLIGEIIVVFILKQEYKGDPKRLIPCIPKPSKKANNTAQLEFCQMTLTLNAFPKTAIPQIKAKNEGPLFGTPVSGINGTSVILASRPVSGSAMLNGGTFGIESS